MEYAACYRRGRPDTDLGPLIAAWNRGEVDAVTVSSSTGLRNFVALAGPAGRRLVESTPLFVPHERVADEARRLGAASAISAGPTNEEMLEALVAYFRAA